MFLLPHENVHVVGVSHGLVRLLPLHHWSIELILIIVVCLCQENRLPAIVPKGKHMKGIEISSQLSGACQVAFLIL